MHLSLPAPIPVAMATVRSNAAILLSLFHCLMPLPMCYSLCFNLGLVLRLCSWDHLIYGRRLLLYFGCALIVESVFVCVL